MIFSTNLRLELPAAVFYDPIAVLNRPFEAPMTTGNAITVLYTATTRRFQSYMEIFAAKNICEARKRIETDRDRYERNLDKRLRCDIEGIFPSHNVFLTV